MKVEKGREYLQIQRGGGGKMKRVFYETGTIIEGRFGGWGDNALT